MRRFERRGVHDFYLVTISIRDESTSNTKVTINSFIVTLPDSLLIVYLIGIAYNANFRNPFFLKLVSQKLLG